jgi:hypothetical protein
MGLSSAQVSHPVHSQRPLPQGAEKACPGRTSPAKRYGVGLVHSSLSNKPACLSPGDTQLDLPAEDS